MNKIAKRPVELNDKYLCDESRIQGGNAVKIFFPKNSHEIAEILMFCNHNKIPVTIYGKGTGITGAAVPFGGYLISIEKMNKVSDIKFDEIKEKYYIEAEAAVTLNEIKEKTDTTKWFYPVDPTEMNASIGGTVATNASGAVSYKFGPTRNWIKAIEVVLMDGRILKIERGTTFADDSGFINFNGISIKVPDYKLPACKNAAGLYSAVNMDIIDLFIGSEGILGIISKVELWLEEKHPSISIVKFFKDEISAISFVSNLKKQKNINTDFIEYFNYSGLEMLKNKSASELASAGIPEIEDEFKTSVFFDVTLSDGNIASTLKKLEHFSSDWHCSWCAWENIEKERIKSFRHALPETVNEYISEVKRTFPSIHKLGTDFAVSDDNFPQLMEFYHHTLENCGIKFVIFGHIGDNHLHINFLPSNYEELEKGKEIYKIIAAKVISLKGTVSAEHGIGKLKHGYLIMMFGGKGVDEMKRVKRIFDPEFLLNRNNMFLYSETE